MPRSEMSQGSGAWRRKAKTQSCGPAASTLKQWQCGSEGTAETAVGVLSEIVLCCLLRGLIKGAWSYDLSSLLTLHACCKTLRKCISVRVYVYSAIPVLVFGSRFAKPQPGVWQGQHYEVVVILRLLARFACCMQRSSPDACMRARNIAPV